MLFIFLCFGSSFYMYLQSLLLIALFQLSNPHQIVYLVYYHERGVKISHSDLFVSYFCTYNYVIDLLLYLYSIILEQSMLSNSKDSCFQLLLKYYIFTLLLLYILYLEFLLCTLILHSFFLEDLDA